MRPLKDPIMREHVKHMIDITRKRARPDVTDEPAEATLELNSAIAILNDEYGKLMVGYVLYPILPDTLTPAADATEVEQRNTVTVAFEPYNIAVPNETWAKANIKISKRSDGLALPITSVTAASKTLTVTLTGNLEAADGVIDVFIPIGTAVGTPIAYRMHQHLRWSFTMATE